MQTTAPIAVTGATGTQGGALARLLLDRGHPVRALTRHPGSDAARALAARGAEVAQADFADPASIKDALQGCRALFLMTTPFGTDADTEAAQGIASIDAAIAAGVEQLVFSSVAHADRGTGVPHFDSKYAVERHLASTDLDWTVIGPAKFMDNYASGYAARLLKEGKLALPLSPGRSIALVCAEDIAGMAAVALTDPGRLSGRRIDIAGEELTGPEQAAAFSARLGWPVHFVPVPHEQARAWGEDLAAMFAYFDNVGLDVDTAALREEFPEVGWHTFADWLGTGNWPEER